MPPKESPVWRLAAASMAAMLVGIGGAGVWGDAKMTANTARISANAKAIQQREIAAAVFDARFEAASDKFDDLDTLVREAVAEMRAFHSR